MTRETLQTVLRAAGAVPEKSGIFKATPEQRLTLYVGGDARGLSVAQVEEVRLEDEFVAIKSKEIQLFADYAAVYAVAAQPAKEGSAPKKAGFA